VREGEATMEAHERVRSEQIVLTCRRVVLLLSAAAKVQQLARNWGVSIKGVIGRHSYRCLEVYKTLEEARKRTHEINKINKAMVTSIEVILFPSGFTTVKYVPRDINLNGGRIGLYQ
jgi:hypothetical protein